MTLLFDDWLKKMNIVQADKTKSLLGSNIILQELITQGVKVIFGYPGGCVIPLFDALLEYPELKFILVRHEQGATHAADGLARVTGKAQVVFATSGPGATNCITGIATALMDSVPMVVITGQVRTEVIGTDAFQETNVVGISRPITKQNYLLTDIADLQPTIKEAFYIANTGRKGPVLIDIPVDLQKQRYPYKHDLPAVKLRGYQPTVSAEPSLVQKAWEMISRSKRPIIYVGGGANSPQSSKELIKFAHDCHIPVATTLLAQGVYPQSLPLALGMLGMHGTYTANTAMTECDLCLVLGARFDDRVTGKVETFLKQAKIIHVDIDPSSLGKIKQADLAIVSDVTDFLKQIRPLAKKLASEQWAQHLKLMLKKVPPPNFYNYPSESGKLRPEYVLKHLCELTAGDAYIVTDVGQHQMFTTLHYKFQKPRSHITSGGLGTMGFSLPAAMGIASLEHDRVVVSISGDGGFQMCMQELATIREYSLAVKIFVFNNSNLGMVKQWQDFFWQSRYASTVFDFNPSFTNLGKIYDIPSFEVKHRPEVRPVIKKALELAGPVLVEFKIDPDAHVYPMVPSGADLKEIIVGEDPPDGSA